MSKCKCLECGIEFDYDYHVTICDKCLAKYKASGTEQNE